MRVHFHINRAIIWSRELPAVPQRGDLIYRSERAYTVTEVIWDDSYHDTMKITCVLRHVANLTEKK